MPKTLPNSTSFLPCTLLYLLWAHRYWFSLVKKLFAQGDICTDEQALRLGKGKNGTVLEKRFDQSLSRKICTQVNLALVSCRLAEILLRMRYYKLPFVSAVDNTDQRISEDINNFCDKAVSLFCTSVVALCDLVVFSIILYKIFPPLYFTLVAYAVVGTFVTVWFGKPLIKKNRLQLKKEADFRFDLVRIREDAESIAFYNG